jgi:hypothetical protein
MALTLGQKGYSLLKARSLAKSSPFFRALQIWGCEQTAQMYKILSLEPLISQNSVGACVIVYAFKEIDGNVKR